MKCFPDDDFYLSKTPHEKGCKKFSDPLQELCSSKII